MSYLVTLDSAKSVSKRFINPIGEDEADFFLPSNCSLIKPGQKTRDQIASIPIVHDTLIPIYFEAGKFGPGEYQVSNEDGLSIIATMLVMTGFCTREAAANATNKKSLVLVNIINERLELLQQETHKHNKLIKDFTEIEKSRDDFFVLPYSLVSFLDKIKDSKTRILKVLEDVNGILDEKDKTVLGEIATKSINKKYVD